MAMMKTRLAVAYALVVQAYFSSPALSFVHHPGSFADCHPQQKQYHTHLVQSTCEYHFDLNPNLFNPLEGILESMTKEDVDKHFACLGAISRKDQTLYEILGASPSATRAELKQKYVQLAKKYHPDAQRQETLVLRGLPQAVDATTEEDSAHCFGDIASAWRILSDPQRRMRYDREMQFQAWADNFSSFCLDKMERAAPVLVNFVDEVAAPLLERTAMTTVRMAQTMVGNKNKEIDQLAERAPIQITSVATQLVASFWKTFQQRQGISVPSS